MSEPPSLARWRAAVTGARQTLSARWRSTLEALEAARHEYGVLRSATAIDVRAMRKAAQRVHDLEQLRAVLARELLVGAEAR
jgi:coenzyme F420-reducing hydrogenase beta subunit